MKRRCIKCGECLDYQRSPSGRTVFTCHLCGDWYILSPEGFHKVSKEEAEKVLNDM